MGLCTRDHGGRLAEVFAARPAIAATTLLVSENRDLHRRARVMDFRCPGRKPIVVTEVPLAAQLIAARRSRTMNRK